MYGCGLVLLKMPKQCPYKVRPGTYFIEKGKLRCPWGFNLFKMLK